MSKFVALLNVFVFMLTAIMSGITKEELVTILDEKLEEKFQRKFDELKQQIDHKLAPLQKMIDEVMETAKFINAKYDDLVEEQKALKLALHTMEAKFYSLAKAHDDLEQYGRRECVEIRGIPVPSDPKSEDTNAVVKSVGDLMGISVTDNDISVSHRMPQSKRYKGKQRGPPAIIAKFTRRVTKDKFYGARSKLHDKSTLDLGSTVRNSIYISESLTEINRELLNDCLKAKKDLKFNFVWTRNGKIFMRHDKDSPAKLISTKDDLKPLYEVE